MADEETGTTEGTSVETEAQPEAPKPGGDVPPEVKAALRKANKEAETLRLKLQEFEDRDKTEAQKLADRAETAERRVAELEARAMRLEVAAEKGLTAAQQKYLTGATREELEANATQILADFNPVPEKVTVPDLDLGPRATGSPEPTDAQGRINAGLAAYMK